MYENSYTAKSAKDAARKVAESGDENLIGAQIVSSKEMLADILWNILPEGGIYMAELKRIVAKVQ